MEVWSFKLLPLLGLLGYVIYWFYGMVQVYWLKPKRLERILREQGFKGNPYRLLQGDQHESDKLLKETLSKPIQLGDNIIKRMMPDVYKTLQTHGKNSFIWIGRYPRVTLTDPTLVKEVLTKYVTFQKSYHDLDPLIEILFTGVACAEGQKWAKHRKIINPAFSFDKLKLMLPAFQMSCVETVNNWSRLIPEGGSAEVDVWKGIEGLSGGVISRALFGTSYEEGSVIVALMKELASLTWEAVRSVYFPGKRFLPLRRNNRMRTIDRELRFKITEMINKKMKAMQAGESGGDDFLGILLESNMNEIKLQGSKTAGLTIEQIISECKVFYWAGQDTSSTLMLWSLVLLSKHPEWQERAREEILQVFGDKDPHYDGLSHLKIVPMILNEVLRLYPPLAELSKVATEDTQLGKYLIPAGVQMMNPQIVLHYDPELWGDDVLEFKPERFSEGVMKATKIQGAYFPFSLGPRMCIGNNFALLASKMALSIILRSISLELSPSYVHAPIVRVTTQPQYGAHLILRKV